MDTTTRNDLQNQRIHRLESQIKTLVTSQKRAYGLIHQLARQLGYRQIQDICSSQLSILESIIPPK